MSTRARIAAIIAPAAFGMLVATAGSCTIFNHIILPVDAGADAPFDAVTDASEPGGSYLTPEEGARFCALAFGCLVPVALSFDLAASFSVPFVASDAPSSQFSMCMHWATEVVRPGRLGFATQQAELRKIAAMDTCSAAGDEAPYQVGALPPACAGFDGGFAVCAEGGAAVILCGATSAVTSPCRPPLYTSGTACAPYGTKYAACVADAGCSGPPFCDGEIAHYCSSDQRAGAVNCGLFGRKCTVVGDAAACEIGGPCTGWRCDGANNLLPCLIDGTGPAFTCPAGTTCTALSYGGYCAPPAGSACSPASGGDRCEGNDLHYCAGGKDAQVACGTVHPGWVCKRDATHPTPTCAPAP
jgi:hypothetical protein